MNKEENLKEQIIEYLEQKESYGNPRLGEIGVSVRTYNCLYRYGVRNLSDLIGKSEQELSQIRNLGKKGVDETLKIAQMYGLKLEREIITGTISEEKVEATQKAEQIYSTKITEMGFSDKTLKYLMPYDTLRSLLYNERFIERMAYEHKDVFQDIVHTTSKYGFSLNKTGFLVLTDLSKIDSVLLKALKENGLEKTLPLCDKKYFVKNTTPMDKISGDVEKYLNWLAEQKLANAKEENFEEVEKDIARVREYYKNYVESQRMLTDIEKAKKSLAAKIAVKNAEVRRYHHKPVMNRPEGHSHNLFIDINREL